MSCGPHWGAAELWGAGPSPAAGARRQSTARAAPFPRQPPRRRRPWKMSAGDRRCVAGFVFRSLPQKAFPCLEDRDVQDRLLKWWEGEIPLQEAPRWGWRGAMRGGWEGGKGRAVWGLGPSRRPQGSRSEVAASPCLSHLTPLAGSLLSIFQARKTLVLRCTVLILVFQSSPTPISASQRCSDAARAAVVLPHPSQEGWEVVVSENEKKKKYNYWSE